MEIGFYICNSCNDLITSNIPYKKLQCLNCNCAIPLLYSKTIDDGEYEEETKKFLELAEYFTDDEAVNFVTDKEFIKRELSSKSVTNWGQGEIGKTGYYKLAKVSPIAGVKQTHFITSSQLVEEVLR